MKKILNIMAASIVILLSGCISDENDTIMSEEDLIKLAVKLDREEKKL